MPSRNILLVDDDVNLLRAAGRAMRGEPFQLFTARSAAEAEAIVKAQPIAVVVSDERMPGGSGTDLLAWIARACPETVRIVITGHANPAITTRAVTECRVSHFFNKPVAAAELAGAMRDGLEQHAAAVERRTAPALA